MDWTADKNASTPYFLIEKIRCDESCKQSWIASEFILKKGSDKWIEIDHTPVVFPVYKFSDNPDSLDKLDFSKLVRLENKANQEWQKYLVFDAAPSRITQSNAVNVYKENKSIQDFQTIDNAKNIALNIELTNSSGSTNNFHYKIINFLTPSFKLEEAIKHQ